jgi:hypothetical protein
MVGMGGIVVTCFAGGSSFKFCFSSFWAKDWQSSLVPKHRAEASQDASTFGSEQDPFCLFVVVAFQQGRLLLQFLSRRMRGKN